MSSKKYYMVPVYQMITEDLEWEDLDFVFLDNIIVFKTESGYEDLDHFNNFNLINSEHYNNIKRDALNSDKYLCLNEDDINEDNRVEFFTFYEADVEFRCYRNLNESFRMKYYNKDNFDDFVKEKDTKVKAFEKIKKTS